MRHKIGHATPFLTTVRAGAGGQPVCRWVKRQIRLARDTLCHTVRPLWLCVQGQGDSLNADGRARRKIGRWKQEEVDELISLTRAYGRGKWKAILEHRPNSFQNRNQVDPQPWGKTRSRVKSDTVCPGRSGLMAMTAWRRVLIAAQQRDGLEV